MSSAAFLQRYNAGVRFNRLSDDIHYISDYISDIRLCFIALTVLAYCLLFAFVVHMCIRHKKKRANNQRRTARGLYDVAPESNQVDYRNQTGQQLEDLVSVRSDGQVGSGVTTTTAAAPPAIGGWSAASRNHRAAAPGFMRHGRNMQSYSSQTHATSGSTSLGGNTTTTRLITTEVDSQVKHHQIPHITTSEIPAHESNGPTGHEDSSNNNGNGGILTHGGMPTRALHHRLNNAAAPTAIVSDTTEM